MVTNLNVIVCTHLGQNQFADIAFYLISCIYILYLLVKMCCLVRILLNYFFFYIILIGWLKMKASIRCLCTT